MKRFRLLSAIIAATAALTLTACGALWTSTSVGVGVDPGYYGGGIYNDWGPTLAGAPIGSPLYWGNSIYPGPPPVPAHRPTSGWTPGLGRPTGNLRPGAANPVPSPAIPSNPGGGSSRPAYQPSQSSGNSIVPNAPININGSNPGPVVRPH